MTKAEEDFLLERFDQTKPALQRQIVAGFIERCAQQEQIIREALALTDTGSEAFKDKFGYLVSQVIGREALQIADYAVPGWRVVEAIRSKLLEAKL